MLIGYARLSPLERQADLDAQTRDLKAAGCEKTFVERAGPFDQRPMLDHALAFLREGDVFVCCRPDRLCRNVARLLNIEADLARRKIALVLLSVGGPVLDTRTPGARPQLVLLACQSALNSFQLTASKSFHLVSPVSSVSYAV